MLIAVFSHRVHKPTNNSNKNELILQHHTYVQRGHIQTFCILEIIIPANLMKQLFTFINILFVITFQNI